jgi:hypothetical protein
VRGKFVIEPALAAVQGDDRRVTESIVRNALAESIRLAMLLAAALALAGAVCVDDRSARRGSRRAAT